MHELRRANLLDYPGIEGSVAEFFAIAHLRRDVLIHVCLLDSKHRVHELKRAVSGQEPDQFDLAFCCWKKTEEHRDLPGELVILAFCKEWCLPNVIYHESLHAGIYVARGTDCNEEDLIDFVQGIQAFCIGALTSHLTQNLPPWIGDRIGSYQDANLMPGYQGQPGAVKEVMWRPKVRSDLWVNIVLFESRRWLKNVTERPRQGVCVYSGETHIALAPFSKEQAFKCPDILLIHFHRKCFNFEVIMHQGIHAALLAFDGNKTENDEGIVQLYDQFSMIVGGQFRDYLT
jgi:hypothetical protein